MSSDMSIRQRIVNDARCRTCGADYGESCKAKNGKMMTAIHENRRADYHAGVELERLRAWKAEAMVVLNAVADIAQSIPGEHLGEMHTDTIRFEIERLRAALIRIDYEGSGVSPECEALAAIARNAIDTP